MPPPLGASTLAVALAHSLDEPYHLPVSPLVASTLAAAFVLVVAFAVPRGADRGDANAVRAVASWSGRLSAAQIGTRLVAVAVLVLAVAAGRLGVDSELDNLAPALVVGALWPLLVLASAAVGPVWRWLDPADSVGRVLAADAGGEAGHVWPAVLPALAWVWYLGAYRDTLDPRSVGVALALYALFALGGALALGRVRWLSGADALGILLAWLALLPARRLTRWLPPRGAEALLGVFAGGVLFGAFRRSELWGGLNTAAGAELYAAAGVVAFSAAAAGLFLLMARAAGEGAARAVAARAALPAVAAIVVAVALDRNRLTTSVQLLPELVGDPFGRGWDPFGAAGSRVDPAPLGEAGLLAAQLGVVVAGHGVAAAVLGRCLDRDARGPAALLLALLASAAVISVVSH